MMTRIGRLFFFMTLLLVSCNKDAGRGGDDKKSIHFKASISSVDWTAGDKISMLAYKTPTAQGLLSSSHVVNFSSVRFTAEADGPVASFNGKIPSLDQLPAGPQMLYAIYPACNLTVSSQSYAEGNSKFYKLTGPSIPQHQDGTGWRYCFFTSTNGSVETTSGEINGPLSFSLANALVSFRYVSGKPIKRIEICQLEQLEPGLAGSAALYTSNNQLAEGCESYSITLENNGDVLPATVSFACRGVEKDRTISITFTAVDGGTVSRSFHTSLKSEAGKETMWPSFDLTEWIDSEWAAQAVKNMGMGINVGGLESVTPTTEALPDRADKDGMHILDRARPETYETNSAHDRITQTTMNALHAAGFSSIRIPVTWYNHMGAPLSEPGVIDEVWLNHVQSVVDLARNADMYVVINLHHDAGTYDSCWLKADWAHYASISAQLKNIWTQIARHFKDYDYHLLFEGYNEICNEHNHWNAPGSPEGFRAANALNQDFVDVVRATGGNNAIRNLIVSTYTASEHEGALEGFVLPQDLIPGHLLVQIHSYRPNEFITARSVGDRSRLEFYESEKAEIDEMFLRVKSYVLDKGWPCVMGEYGAFSKKDAKGNRNELGRAEHAYYYTTRALQYGICPMYWYNPMTYRDRDSGDWTYPVTAQGLIDAWNDYKAGVVVYKKYNHDAVYPIGD